ncbi:MAG: ferrous iron transporter B [Oscillospiraceae bacterium]|nr:ferrous iron transporter B [Oscillospiraceae bacterium]
MELRIALAGNPNCGKTTLFNALTGSNQFVGNWPGVTVEKKEGKLKQHEGVTVTDLPGIYSLSPYTLEEVVARSYLVDERPEVILNIIDGTNLERNLYLSTQLMELGIPVVLAVNMMDIVEKNGDHIDTEELSRRLGCRIVCISALKGTGLMEAAEAAIEAAGGAVNPPQHIFSGAVEHALAHIEEAAVHPMPDERQRWYAIKIFERDEKVLSRLQLPEATLSHIEADIRAAEKELDDDAESIITNERYNYITSLMKTCYRRKRTGKLTTSDKIDKVVTNRFAALPIFAVIMFLVYYISVTTVGGLLTDWANDGLFGEGWHLFGIGSGAYEEAMNEYAEEHLWTEELQGLVNSAAEAGIVGAEDLQTAIEDGDFAGFEEAYGSYGDVLAEKGYDLSAIYDAALGDGAEGVPDPADYPVWVPGISALAERGLEAAGTPEWLKSLLLDGIIGGVGAVLGFVPQMIVLFLFLAFLEACGYMSRIAFVLDKLFRKFGLSGKSFIPVLIGTGCGVPGIMASRTIENERDRRMTIMTTTFIPCGAKLPVIALIASAMFGGAWWVAPSAYFIGIAAIVVSGIMLKKTRPFSGEPAPFVMELPAYHWPTVSNLLRSMWERSWSFIKKAGTVILLASLLVWAGSSFGVVEGSFLFDPGMDLENSLLGILGGALCWLFAPLGFGNIKAAIATIMGLLAKEEIVGVFGVLDFEGMTKLTAYAFLVFNLLCAPCFAAMGAIRREMNSGKWTLFAIGYQCVFAYAVSLMIYQFGLLFTGGVKTPVQGIGTVAAFLVLAMMLFQLFRPHREAVKAAKKTETAEKEKVNA